MNSTSINVSDKPPALSPEGYHIAYCIGVIQIGTIYVYNHYKNMLRLEFELPNEIRTFNPADGPKPKMLTKEYAASLYGESWLKKHLISWFGVEFVETFSKDYDVSMLLGQKCIVRNVHKVSSQNKWYEDITEIHPYNDEYDYPAQQYPNRVLLLGEDSFDKALFLRLPQFLQDKIKGSQEYKKLSEGLRS